MTISQRNDIAISITNKCNLACPHCLRGGSTEDHIASAFLDKVLKDASPFGFSFVSITGGEPFMHPRFKKIVETIIANDYEYNFVTNGLPYQEYYDHILGTPLHRKFSNLAVSLDGSTKEIHGSVRKSALSWVKATEAIKFYSKRVHNPVTVNFFANQKNKDDTGEVIRLAKELGADTLWIAGSLPVPPSIEPPEDALTYRQKEEIIFQAQSTSHEVNLDVKYASCFLDISKIAICPNLTNPQPHINPRGELTFCCNMSGRSAVIGDLHSQTFEELWEELVTLSASVKDLKIAYVEEHEGEEINENERRITNCDFCHMKLKEKIDFF